MEVNDVVRSAVALGGMTGGDNEVAGVKMRPLSMGSILQLQRLDNPYGLLATIEADENGDVNIWKAAGVNNEADMYYYGCEAIWLHCEEEAEVDRQLAIHGYNELNHVVEMFMRRFALRDALTVLDVFKRDVLEVQLMMVSPDASSLEDADPLEHGQTGQQP